MNLKEKTVATLQINESAIIQSFSDDLIAMKLASMGVLPQSKVTLVRKAPFNDPLYVKINDSQSLVLRAQEAQAIQVL